MRILVADTLDPAHFAALDGTGIEVVDRAGIDADELSEVIADYEALVVRSRTKVTEALLGRAGRLKVVGRAGTGVDNIDLAAATKRGVLVMNTPGANSNSAAEHAVAMMLSLSRHVPAADAAMRDGRFGKKGLVGVEVMNKTLCVLGLGRIGLLVARKAQGLGMRVVGFDPVITEERARQASITLLSLEDAVAQADYVSIHVPLVAATKHLVDADLIARMREGVRIVNCARGGIVEEDALLDAVRSGHVAGAALDVFEVEPPQGSPLLDEPRVVVTPHLGASTEEAQATVSRAILEQVGDYLLGRGLRGAINGLPVDDATREVVGPYFALAERLGRLLAGLQEGGGTRLRVRYYGPLTTVNVRPLTAYFLKGFLARYLGTECNELNAHELAKERGLVVEETTRDEHRSFQSLLWFALEGEDGEVASIAGTLFGKNNFRIVRIGDYDLDAIPEGRLLVVHNQDVPGMIGILGQAMGKAGVNIANMAVSRAKKSGDALAVLNLDGVPSGSVLASLRQVDGIHSIKLVNAEGGA